MYVCVCRAVRDADIHSAVEQGARSMRDLREALQVATQCGRCARCAKACLSQAVASRVEMRDEAA